MNQHPVGSRSTTGKINYALALNQSDWESDFFQAFAAEFQQRGVIKRCVDAVDLVADVLTQSVDIAILDADFSGLDASTVARMASGARVVGLCSSLEGEARLRQWGIERIVLLDTNDVAHGVRALVDIVLEIESRSRQNSHSFEIPGDLGSLDMAEEKNDGQMARRRGKRIVIWSATAGAGVTTLATGLAEAQAAQGRSTSLLDVDLDHPSLADSLALADDTGGLLRSCRQAERGAFAPAEFAATSRALSPTLRVLSGVNAPHRQVEVKPIALTRVVNVAAALDESVVVDLGAPWISCAPGLAGDELRLALAGQDEARTSVVEDLQAGDVVMAVVPCSPIAIARALPLVEQVARLNPEVLLAVVVNGARKSILGGAEPEELVEQLTSAISRRQVTCVRYDRSTADKALLSGRSMTETDPRSEAVKDMRGLSEWVEQMTNQTLHAKELVGSPH